MPGLTLRGDLSSRVFGLMQRNRSSQQRNIVIRSIDDVIKIEDDTGIDNVRGLKLCLM